VFPTPKTEKKLIGWLMDMGVVEAAVAMIEPAITTRRTTKATVFLFTSFTSHSKSQD
jgi:hypothetical protein